MSSELRVDTIKLANGNTATASGLGIGGVGKIGQITSGFYSAAVANTSASYVDTGLSCSITPTATSSKVLVLANQSWGKNNTNTQIDAQLERAISGGSTTAPYTEWLNDNVYTGDSSYLYTAPSSLVFLDTPSTTSAITYKTQFRNAAATGIVTANTNNTFARMVLMEVLA
jgi:hypothetical protein